MGLIEILWTVTGVVVPLLLGTAWAMVGLTPPEFWIARGCAGLAALILGATALIWLSTSGWPNTARIFVGLVLGAAALITFSEVIRWINARESFVVSQSATAIDKRADVRKQLQQFYVVGGTFIDADLPKDISEGNFKEYEATVDQWANSTANWIAEHLGQAARAKFLDRSSMPFLSYNKAVNESHNNLLNAVTAFRKNLSTLIETGAWDDKK
jgi:hypothetical protein